MNIMLAEKLAARGYKFIPKQKQAIEEPPKPTHTHNWRIYKQYVGINKNMQQFWFVIRGCPDCKEKHAIDMTREEPNVTKYTARQSNGSSESEG